MSFRTTLLLVIVCALLGGGFWWFQYGPGKSGGTVPKIVELDPLSVQRIEITQGDKKVVYQKSFLKIWEMLEPRYNVVDSRMIEVVTVLMSSLPAMELSNPGPRLADYGLAPADYVAKFTLANNTVVTMHFGLRTPDGRGYYAKKEGEEKVFLIPAQVADPILELFRNPPVTPTPTPTRTETPWPAHIPTPTVTATWTPWPTFTPTAYMAPTVTMTPTSTPPPRTPPPLVIGTSTATVTPTPAR